MAATASATPTRRVLGDKNVNTPVTNSIGSRAKCNTNSPQKPDTMGARALLQKSYEKTQFKPVTHQQALVDGTKRAVNFAEVNKQSSKRIKTQSSMGFNQDLDLQGTREEEVVSVSQGANHDVQVGSVTVSLVNWTGLPNIDLLQSTVGHLEGPASTSVSPSSSFASYQADFNDSQNTIITEPDEIAVPVTIHLSAPPSQVSTLSRAELRKVGVIPCVSSESMLTISREPWH